MLKCIICASWRYRIYAAVAFTGRSANRGPGLAKSSIPSDAIAAAGMPNGNSAEASAALCHDDCWVELKRSGAKKFCVRSSVLLL